eukprot:TRINITY_DN32616_c0_g1_i1.p1 TRINITY_DN32616_c0_g1~~TRINITY_DN32616_c0_g1_i1.p1  ORF type:complete len:484 (+),score=43.39 TRINITY_DN32616_c0_g1_i1:102-1553(+)
MPIFADSDSEGSDDAGAVATIGAAHPSLSFALSVTPPDSPAKPCDAASAAMQMKWSAVSTGSEASVASMPSSRVDIAAALGGVKLFDFEEGDAAVDDKRLDEYVAMHPPETLPDICVSQCSFRLPGGDTGPASPLCLAPPHCTDPAPLRKPPEPAPEETPAQTALSQSYLGLASSVRTACDPATEDSALDATALTPLEAAATSPDLGMLSFPDLDPAALPPPPVLQEDMSLVNPADAKPLSSPTGHSAAAPRRLFILDSPTTTYGSVELNHVARCCSSGQMVRYSLVYEDDTGQAPVRAPSPPVHIGVLVGMAAPSLPLTAGGAELLAELRTLNDDDLLPVDSSASMTLRRISTHGSTLYQGSTTMSLDFDGLMSRTRVFDNDDSSSSRPPRIPSPKASRLVFPHVVHVLAVAVAESEGRLAVISEETEQRLEHTCAAHRAALSAERCLADRAVRELAEMKLRVAMWMGAEGQPRDTLPSLGD